MADGGPTAGTIAWLLWGGTSGVNWAKKQSAALGAEESFTDDEKDRVRERLIRLNKPASDSFIEGYLTAKKDLEQRKPPSKKQAESFEAEKMGKGRRMLSNTEILKILPNQQYKCAICLEGYYEPLKEIQLMDLIQMPKYELLNNPDYNININIISPKMLGGRMRLPTGEVNKNNIEICCDECAETEQFTATMPKVMIDQLRRGAKKRGITPARHMYNILKLSGIPFEAESFEADDDVFTHSVVLGFKFRYYTKQNPIYKKKQDGSFNLDPIHIVKLKILILREMDLEGVEYDDATITADSLLFKFNFTNEIEAQKFNAYAKEYLSQNEKVEQLQQYFIKADARVMTKYEAGIIFSTLMDWSNREYLIDFLEYLIKLEEYDYEYSLQFIRERGVDINEQDDYGVSLKDLMLAEKEGYQSMLEELVNDLKNKGRSLDEVAFTLSADNGLKNQTMTSMFAIQQEVERGVVNKTMSIQFMRYQGKLQAIDDFLYYVYRAEDSFIFDNI